MSLTRRNVLSILVHGSALAMLAPVRQVGAAVGTPAESPSEALAELERTHGGRLGVCVLDAQTLQPLAAHRADERFGMCSTFKLLLAAAVLREADAGRIDLGERIGFGREDLVSHSPVVEQHLAEGALSIRALAHAIQTTSDNAAANLLLARFDGPAGFTRYLRGMGDAVTRLDRMEPTMNLVRPGEAHDTTTPLAMATIVARVFAGTATTAQRGRDAAASSAHALLSADSRVVLKQWMIETRTGMKRLRAGFPSGWEAGDKTGTGIAEAMPNRHNDVAVVWRDGQPALVVAAYYEADGHYPRMRSEDDAVLAAVGRIAAPSLASTYPQLPL